MKNAFTIWEVGEGEREEDGGDDRFGDEPEEHDVQRKPGVGRVLFFSKSRYALRDYASSEERTREQGEWQGESVSRRTR